MELNLARDGTVNDPQGILKKNGLESGSGRPVIRINHTKEFSIYSGE